MQATRSPIASATIEVTDERYSYLLYTQRRPTSPCSAGTFMNHLRWHPIIWARDTGGGQVVYDGLGHDTRSCDSLATLS
jgi:type 1 glutamine amidotransferase